MGYPGLHHPETPLHFIPLPPKLQVFNFLYSLSTEVLESRPDRLHSIRLLMLMNIYGMDKNFYPSTFISLHPYPNSP
jgi:hypothetical protein